MVPAKFELRRNASAWEGGKPEGDLSLLTDATTRRGLARVGNLSTDFPQDSVPKA
jgi:hypothetical protein